MMRPMWRRFAVPLVVSLVGCGSCHTRSAPDAGPVAAVSADWLEGRLPAETGQPRRGGTLVVRAPAEPAGLNPLEDRFRDGWTIRITRNLVLEALLEIDPVDYSLRPQLAESWKDSDDHRVTTFVLRQGVTFHDHTALTAKDVAAVLEAVMDPKRPTSALRSAFTELEGWKVIDERTIELRWRRPSPFVLRALAQLPILPAASLAGDWSALASSPIGTGPYRVASWERGGAVKLERAGAWWGGEVNLDRIVFRVVKDATVAAALFERGEVDVMCGIQPAAWRAMERDPSMAWARTGWNRFRSPDNSFSYIAWNEALPFFADARVRRALAHLYPAELAARTIDLGLEPPTTCPHFTQGGRCDEAVKPISFSVSEARAELADAGFADADGDGVLDRDGTPLRFHLLIPATSVRLGKLAPLLQEQARLAGVDLIPEKADVATLSTRVSKHDFEAVSRIWTEFDADHELSYIFHTDGGSNFVGYSSPEADRLLDEIRGTWDLGHRRELERALHRRLYEDQPYLFMTVRQSLDAAKTTVKGLRPSLQWYDLRRAWVER